MPMSRQGQDQTERRDKTERKGHGQIENQRQVQYKKIGSVCTIVPLYFVNFRNLLYTEHQLHELPNEMIHNKQ